jgi:hypothetical protein
LCCVPYGESLLWLAGNVAALPTTFNICCPYWFLISKQWCLAFTMIPGVLSWGAQLAHIVINFS